MPLGTDVGLGPGHIVLDGDPAPPSPKRGTAPNFRPMSIVAKRLDDQDTNTIPLGTEVGLDPSNIMLDGDPAPHERGTAAAPLSGRCLLWPRRSPILATAELLSHIRHCIYHWRV